MSRLATSGARAVLVLAAVAVVAVAGGRAAALLPAFSAWVDGLGALGPLVFVVGYALATVAFVPGSLLTLAAGALFGLVEGTALVLVAATVGASLAVLVARYLARGRVEQRLAGNHRSTAIDRAIGAQGRTIVFLLRLSPLVPFNLLNYALGLTRVRFADYLVASVGMLPGTLLYVYYGKVVGDVAKVAAGVSPPHGPEYYALLITGLIATIVASTSVTRAAKRAMNNARQLQP